MKPLISICMPNYNCEKHIGEAVESVLSQTYPNFELIIMDDASTDSSREIVKSYNDPRIRLYQNKANIHMTPNINKALHLTNGELITILHSDDKYAPNFLEEIVKAYNQYPDQRVFVTGVHNLHHEENYTNPGYPFKTGGIIQKREVLIRLAFENNIGNAASLAVHKDCFKKIGLYSSFHRVIPDYDYMSRLANEFDFVYIPKLLVYYRVHDGNITHNYVEKPIRYQCGSSMFYKNIIGSRILPEDIHEKLISLQNKWRVHKAFNMGIRYKSGTTTRLVLKYSKDLYPVLKTELFWYFVYYYSYLINSKHLKFAVPFISLIGRIVLYPQKVYLLHYLERIVESVNRKYSFPQLSGGYNLT